MKIETKRNKLKFLPYFSPILFSCFLGYSNLSQAALPNECLNLTAPATFVESTGTLCLKHVKVFSNNDTQFYKAALRWSGSNNPNRFDLLEVELDEASEQNNPSFSGTGLLTLPTVDITKTFGTERYAASMVYKIEQGQQFFELLAVDTYINPDYIPNQTWKPYVLLNLEERLGVDLLARSLPYAKLASAVYDFDIAVEGWQLVEQVSRDSGMQAGGYYNESTGQIVVAFRGTESCDGLFSCSFEELKEEGKDLAADLLLTIGKSDEQFDDAVNYLQDLATRFPNNQIIITGHSLGGSLAQAAGSTFEFEVFAFNSAPVPEEFFDKFPSTLSEEDFNRLIHVLADIHDPVSNTDVSSPVYTNSHHLSSLIQFDFDEKEVLPDLLSQLDDIRFNKHGMDTLIENMTVFLMIYSEGW